MSILDMLQQHVGDSQVQQISQQIGADPATTQTALQAAMPMLLGAMAQHAQTPEGAGAVEQALGDHSGMLGNLGGMLGGGGGAGGLGGLLGGAMGALGGGGGGGGLLGRVLGSQQQPVQDGVAQASGLNQDQVKKLLMIAAPIALAAFAHRRSQQQQAGAGANVAGDLHREAAAAHAQVQQQSPAVGGLIGKFLSLGTRPPR